MSEPAKRWLVCPVIHHGHLESTLNNLASRGYQVRWILDAGVSAAGATATVVAELVEG